MSCSDFPKLRRGKRGFYDRGEKAAHKIFDSVVIAACCHINLFFQLVGHLCFFNKRIPIRRQCDFFGCGIGVTAFQRHDAVSIWISADNDVYNLGTAQQSHRVVG